MDRRAAAPHLPVLPARQVQRSRGQGRRGPHAAHAFPLRLRAVRQAGKRDPHLQRHGPAVSHGGQGGPVPSAAVRPGQLRSAARLLHGARARHGRVDRGRAGFTAELRGPRLSGPGAGDAGVLFPHPRSLFPDCPQLSRPRRPAPQLEIVLFPASLPRGVEDDALHRGSADRDRAPPHGFRRAGILHAMGK